MQREGKQTEEETAGKLRQEANLTPVKKTDDLKDKIILAVLDYLDSKSSVTDVEKAEELRMDAARTVSQVLLSSTEAWEITRSSSSSETNLNSEAMAQSGFPTYTLRSVLDSASHEITQTIEGHKNLSSYRNFILDRLTKRTKKVKAFLEVSKALVKERGTEFAEPPSAPHIFRTDDLTIRCTNYIIDGIIQVCRPHGGGESKELSKQGVEEVMQELESIISSRGSSSRNDLEVIDLEESQKTSHLPLHQESFLSNEFHQKVKDFSRESEACFTEELIEDLLSLLDSHHMIEDRTRDYLTHDCESPGLASSASNRADDYNPEEYKTHSSSSRPSTGQTPDSTRESEACFTEELIEDLLLLLDSHHTIEDRTGDYLTHNCESPGLASSASNSADDYNPEKYKTHSSSSRQVDNDVPTAWETLEDLSSNAEGPPTSNPFTVFSRVKDFRRDRFTGAGRPSTGHTPDSTRESEACFTEELIEDLLSLLDSNHTIEDRTGDYLTRDCESPGLASSASNRADDYNPEEYKPHSSSSRQVDNDVPVDPDPGAAKKVSLRIRKRLRRAFSAIRRALPNPFHCMSVRP